MKKARNWLWLNLIAATILISGIPFGNPLIARTFLFAQAQTKKQSAPFDEGLKIINDRNRQPEAVKVAAEKLSQLLAQHPDVRFEKDIRYGALLLHWAASEAKPDLVRVILDSYNKPEDINQVQPNATNNNRSTPLHLTAGEDKSSRQKDSKAVVELLLNRDWTKQWLSVGNNKKDTPLHLAVTWRNQGVVELLINNKANLTAIDSDGATPLLDAAESGNFKAVWWLWRAGAKVNDLNGAKENALTLAARGYFEEKRLKPNSPLLAEYRKIARLLLANGVDDSETRKRLEAVQPGLGKWLESVNSKAALLKTDEMLAELSAAEIAAELAQVDYSKPKPQSQLDSNRINDLLKALEPKQFTAILLTVAKKSPQSLLRTIIKLTDVLQAQDEDGNTLLHLAAREGQEDVVVLLLVYGGRSLLERKNKAEEMALDLAKFRTPLLGKIVRMLSGDNDKPFTPK